MSQTSILEHISDVVLKDPEELDFDAFQPRLETVIDDAFLESIRSTRGNLTPILITKKNEIVSGHRRAEACRKLGFPVSCRILPQMNESEYWELAITENIAREDMTAYEEVLAIHRLIKMGYSTRQIHKTVGMSVGRVNALASCSSDEHLLSLVKNGMSIYTVSRLKNLPVDIRKRVLEKGLGDKELQKFVKLYEAAKGWDFDILHYMSYVSASEAFEKMRLSYWKEKFPNATMHDYAAWHNASMDPLRKKQLDRVCELCGDVIIDDSTHPNKKQLDTCSCGMKYCISTTKWHAQAYVQHRKTHKQKSTCNSCGTEIDSGKKHCDICNPTITAETEQIIEKMKDTVEIPTEEEEKLRKLAENQCIICYKKPASQKIGEFGPYCFSCYNNSWVCVKCDKRKDKSKIVEEIEIFNHRPNQGICKGCNTNEHTSSDILSCEKCQRCGLCEGCKKGNLCLYPFARSCHSCKKNDLCELFADHSGKCMTYHDIMAKHAELEREIAEVMPFFDEKKRNQMVKCQFCNKVRHAYNFYFCDVCKLASCSYKHVDYVSHQKTHSDEEYELSRIRDNLRDCQTKLRVLIEKLPNLSNLTLAEFFESEIDLDFVREMMS